MAKPGRGKGKAERKGIKDKIIKSAFVDWRELEILQPEGFKELSKLAYQKLRNSIIENNFVESFKVWEKGKIYCLDGVHRCKVLGILDSEGYDIPEKFRADFIECKDEKQAKKMVLVYSSRYAKLLEEGLYGFVQDLNWDELIQTIDLSDIDLEQFTDGWMRDERDVKVDESKKTITVTIELNSKHEYIFVQALNFALNENETQNYDNTMRFIMDQYGLNARNKALMKLCESYLISHGRKLAS